MGEPKPPPGKPWLEPGYNPKEDEFNEYGFVPSKIFNIGFLAAFAVLTVAHLAQMWISRRWFMACAVMMCLGEVIGWAARVMSAFDLYNENGFMIQTVCLIVTPAFLSAVAYGVAGWIIDAVDPALSPLSPQNYWRIFVGCDVISLVVQSAGGGMAASADDKKGVDLGSDIMLAGIVIQLVATTAFSLLFFWYLGHLKGAGVHPAKNVQWLITGNIIAVLMIAIRGVYRVIELAQGWNGYLITNEPFFLLDAIPMVIGTAVFNVVHPHWTLPLGGRQAAVTGRGRYSHVKEASKSTIALNDRSYDMQAV